jgi:hypothetical protein
MTRDPIEEWGGINLYGFCLNSPLTSVDLLGNDWFDCAAKCFELNDPMNAIMNYFASKMLALFSSGVVPKRLVYLVLKAGGRDKEAGLVLSALKNPSGPEGTLAWKPIKILAEKLLKTNGKIIAKKITRVTTPIMVVYGNVLAVVEVECCIHCIGKKRYDSKNGLKFFNVQESVDYYLKDLDVVSFLAPDKDLP